MGKFVKTLFSITGLLIGVYLAIGVFVGPPAGQGGKFPPLTSSGGNIGHWITFAIQVALWPIGVIFHHPTITL